MKIGKKTKSPQSDFVISFYPVGTFIHTERGWYYVAGPSRRLKCITKRVVDSWNPITIVETTENHPAVKRLKVDGRLKFRNNSLLYSHASGRVYLISQGNLRHITNPDVLGALGFRLGGAVQVSLDEINLHEKGEPING